MSPYEVRETERDSVTGGNKMVNPYNGPAAKLLTPPTLTLVKMIISGHLMVLQTTLPKITWALMSSLPQVAKVT